MMPVTAASSNSLDGLLALVEYVKDAKKRAKELTELRDARDELIEARKTLERTNGGVAKLAQAADTLAVAQTAASNVLSEANTDATKLVEDARRKAGDTAQERENITRDTRALANKVLSFDKTSTATVKELERREERATKREKDIARARGDLRQDELAFRQKAENVTAALKG